MSSYVVEDPVTTSITDLFGFRVNFYKLFKVIGIISAKTPAKQLITGLLLCAKQEQADTVLTVPFGLKRDDFEYLLEAAQ